MAELSPTRLTSASTTMKGVPGQPCQLLIREVEDSNSPAVFVHPEEPSMSLAELGGVPALRNSCKTLKCPKCNWHYKYQETLEIHMKEKHSESEVVCSFCAEGKTHPRLSRGEAYSCGYKPYRCEVCKYSTTTKGNLSIHMQSDKHLHAIHELPSTLASVTSSSAEESRAVADRLLLCLVCGFFSTDSVHDIISHIEKDRSEAIAGDISCIDGVFRCLLCPYTTTLKANFQLHTRTDKHLQRIQLVNHVREGLGPGESESSFSPFHFRLRLPKSNVQVFCRRCQRLFSSVESLRDHARDCGSVGGRREYTEDTRQRVDGGEEREAEGWGGTRGALLSCSLCSFKTASRQHATAHLPAHSPSTWLPSTEEEGDCGEEVVCCPLCDSPSQPSSLAVHLVQVHKTAESAVSRLLLSSVESRISFSCLGCDRLFSSESSRDSHQLLHVFSASFLPLSTPSINSQPSLSDLEKRENRTGMTDLAGNAALQSTNSKTLSSSADPFLPPSSSAESAQQLAMVNILSMAQMLHLMQNSNGESSAGGIEEELDGEGVEEQEEEEEDEEEDRDELASPSDSKELFKMLERLGDPALMAQTSDLEEQGLLVSLSPQRLKTICRSLCSQCNAPFSSILALKVHWEALHSHISSFPSIYAQDFISRLRAATGEKGKEEDATVVILQEEEGARDTQREEAPPEKKRKIDRQPELPQHMALLNMLSGVQMNPLMSPSPFLQADLIASLLRGPPPSSLASVSSPAKRARTRITDQQLKILRQYFDINNSPSEEQIREMSVKAGLPEKVIKHWFRNTLFKERQRDKDSPYNFSIPPLMGIDLDTYEKTGETKVVPLTEETSKSAEKKEDVNEEKKSRLAAGSEEGEKSEAKPSSSSSSSTSSSSASHALQQADLAKAGAAAAAALSLQSMFSSAGANSPFPFPISADAAGNLSNILSGSLHSLPSGSSSSSLPSVLPPSSHSSSSSGRRANRTRFTDFQLRTLQEFFNKQAYPKDDDLEVLSKKLQLSPRVIVVWFQNARQKARKIYENQPTAEGMDRFVRTPGCNFQCKRCQLVFQRYYELIEHQQKKCYKDDKAGQADDNKGVVEAAEVEEESGEPDNERESERVQGAPVTSPPPDLAAFFRNGKSSTEALLKMCEASASSSEKRCPYCAAQLSSEVSLEGHISSSHSDLTPNLLQKFLQQAMTSSTQDSVRRDTPLDLSAAAEPRGESLSLSPFACQSEDDENTVDCKVEDSLRAGSDSPSLGNSSLLSSHSSIQPRSPNSGNKRYRTHLTPLQVHVMKCIFMDYKTPQMSECETLGRHIGLHKRVVQVWFQNARAKERKSRPGGDSGETSRAPPSECVMCGVEYTSRLSMQEHLFTAGHLSRLKDERVVEESEFGQDSSGSAPPATRPRAAALRDSTPKARPSRLPPAASPATPSFPFSVLGLQNMAAAASAFAPFLMDANILGTPIPLLQIPHAVMTQISADLAAGKESTSFTQDGLSFSSLKADLSKESDRAVLTPKQCPVGWACSGCAAVFPSECLLSTHQSTLCQPSTGHSLTLIQSHYGCSLCSAHFGTQDEFKAHITTVEHKEKAGKEEDT